MDRRPATAGRPRRPAVALSEEVLGLPQGKISGPKLRGARRSYPESTVGALERRAQLRDLVIDRTGDGIARNRSVDVGVEAAHLVLKPARALDQVAQAAGQHPQRRFVDQPSRSDLD